MPMVGHNLPSLPSDQIQGKQNTINLEDDLYLTDSDSSDNEGKTDPTNELETFTKWKMEFDKIWNRALQRLEKVAERAVQANEAEKLSRRKTI